MFFTRFVSLIAAIVVFVTTYALVLPAITLEKTASCGLDEHQHSDACYEYVLTCGQEESEGHHHDDSCYTVTRELECDLDEHQHSRENGCYDEEGNLICQLEEHTHDDACYSEVKTLTCGREESEGHHHSDACYEKVLVCGKDVHTHSKDCYVDDGEADESNAEAADQASSVPMPEEAAGEQAAEAAAEETLPDNYVPELEPLNMEAVFGRKTGFYYFHAEEGQEVPSNSAEITDWQKVKDDTELAPTDLVKMYLPYTIPAGSLNETNPTARYRLPGNIHLTDDQIKAINKNENGITAGYSESDPEYRMYLGAEAIEGDRTPDELLRDGAEEFISAVVRAENVYENDKYIGQDLIFTFVPYTIEQNQTIYDAEKNPVSTGKKISGWFACDFRLDQIDWIEEEKQEETKEEVQEDTQEIIQEESEETDQGADYDPDNEAESASADENSSNITVITIEKTADILFVSEDKDEDIQEIRRTLKQIEKKEISVSEEEKEEEKQEFQSGTLTADGDGYKITLDYTEEAKIPENASLSVREITAETDKEAYEACLAQAQQHVDESGEQKSTVDSNASRFFDIEIQVINEDGTRQKIEPAAPVSVNIQIADAPADTTDSESGSKGVQNSDPTVLHFVEEGVEQIEATTSAGEAAAEKGTSESDAAPGKDADTDSDKESNSGSEGGETKEIRFEAESFSIYGVVYMISFKYEIDGEEHFFNMPYGGSIMLSKLLESAYPDLDYVQIENVAEVSVENTSEDLQSEVTEETEEQSDGLPGSEIIRVVFDETTGDYEIITLVNEEKDLSSKEAKLIVTFINGQKLTFTITAGGTPRIDAGLAIISSSDGTYLPEDAAGTATVLSDGSSAEAMAKIEQNAEKNAVETEEAAEESHEEDENADYEADEDVVTAEEEAQSSEDESKRKTKYQAFDIALDLTEEQMEFYQDGFQVDLTLPQAVIGKDFHLYHIHDDIIEELAIEKTSSIVDATGSEVVSEIRFSTENFSEFVLTYTVDFHWEVDGKMYNLSIPGGGFASFTKLMEVIGVAHNNLPRDNNENSEVIHEAENSETIETFSLNNVQVSEETKGFVADVEDVVFSSPDLVWVGKTTSETTVEHLKTDNNLEVQYSGELTEEQIAQINEQTVEAGDWALISLKSFITTETLTVTMKNRETFTIRVTDATPARVTNLNTSGLNGLFTVNMFNYGPSSTLDKEANHVNNGTAWNNDDSNVQQGINGYTLLDFMSYGTQGWGANHFTGNASIRQGIVNPTLNTNGYPTLSTNSGGGALDSLFNTTANGTTKQVYQNVQGLFYKSNVDGSSNTNGSYYSYDSDRYYAYKNSSNQIEFYQQYNFANINYGDQNAYDKDVTDNNMGGKPVGFFPFTSPDNSKLCPHPNDVTWSEKHHGNKYGSGYYDHQFGLTMAGDFMIPEGKKIDNQNMVFKFSGDDDMWVFIDDVLVLDIGGIHNPSSGQIDFTTGKVTVDDPVVGVRNNNTDTINMTNGRKVTADISTIFSNAGKQWDDSEYSSHSIKIFYLERGGIYSNCKITFNIPLTLGKGSASIVKKDADKTVSEGSLAGAIFGLWTNPECTGNPIMTRISAADGYIKFENLTVGSDSENLQVYYLKEIKPPYGYKKDDSIYTLTAGSKQNGVYQYNITDKDGNPIEKMEHEPYYPIINNTKATPIGLELSKKWQAADDTVNDLDEDLIPEDVTAEFRVKRYKSFDIVELGSDGIYRIIYSERELDSTFNNSTEPTNTIQLPNSGSQDPWKHVFSNLPLTSQGNVTYNGRQYQVQFYYEYFIEETDTPDGYETIYFDGDQELGGGHGPSELATGEDNQTQTVKNRELLDIPVQKHWDDFLGEGYDWTATLQLDYRDIPVPLGNVNVNDIQWNDYNSGDPAYCKQISKANPTAEFKGLPEYITNNNGNRYRREYSIKEVAYKVTRLSDDTVIFSYENGVVYPPGDSYTPWFDHDAGEDDDYNDDIYPGADDYNIVVHNLRENRNIQKDIELSIEKEWPDSSYYSNPDAKAVFRLRRYILTEYRNYEGTEYELAPRVEIILSDGENIIETLEVPKGVPMSIHGYLKPGASGNIVFNPGITYEADNQTSEQAVFDIPFTASEDMTLTLVSGQNLVVGGASGFRFKEQSGSSQAEEIDNSFCIEFELSDGHWSKSFPEDNTTDTQHHSNDILPAVEVSVLDANGNTANTYVYRYFFEEVECTPSSFNATFTDSQGNEFLGDEDHQIYFDTSVKATNRPTGLDLLKVDMNHTENTLSGAKFQMRKLDVDEGTGVPHKVSPEGQYVGEQIIEPNAEATDANGKLIFKPETGLELGYYEVRETYTPAGYILLEDPTFYIKVEELGVIKLLKKDTSGSVLWDQAAEEGETVGNVSISSSSTVNDGKTITVTVSNKPGASLPNCGGPGTRLFTILGTILIAGAGLLLWRRRRII